MDVPTAISQMSALVQQGRFDEAEAFSWRAGAPFPLSIPKAALALGRPLSVGAQASVHEATLRLDALPPTLRSGLEGAAAAHGDVCLQVAIKRAFIRSPEDLVRLRSEVALLAQLQHPHVVALLGAHLLPPSYSILLGLEATNAGTELHTAGWRPGWARAAALGAQLASAVAHLHSAGVLHRDIKPANVLLNGDRTHCKLADFGIAVRLHESDTPCSSTTSNGNARMAAGTSSKPSGGFYKAAMVGTLEYLAPEILVKRPHSCASDVFALAVTLNELACGQVPYSDCTKDNPAAHTILEMGYGRQELAVAVVAEGLRPTPAPAASPAMLRLLRACWDALPERRPTAAEVAVQLAQLAQQLNADGHSCKQAALQQATLPLPLPVDLPAHLPPSVEPPTDQDVPGWAEALLAGAGELPSPRIGSFACCGARGEDRMEDRCVVVRCFNGLPGCHLLGVFDGHRGTEAAEYLAASLEGHLQQRWAGSASAGELLQGALMDADAAFCAQQDAAWAARQAAAGGALADSLRRWPGSTAAVALLVGRLLAVANLGDSRIVLCRDGAAVTLTQDQTAAREDERQRIAAAGGEVIVRLGGWRVGAAGLEVSRSVGDGDLKAEGVSAEAEVQEVEVGEEACFVVAGSDGLWEWVSSEQAAGLVQDTVKQPAMCAQRLVTEALARGSQDNVTALVAFLGEGGGSGSGTAERVFHAGKLKPY